MAHLLFIYTSFYTPLYTKKYRCCLNCHFEGYVFFSKENKLTNNGYNMKEAFYMFNNCIPFCISNI